MPPLILAIPVPPDEKGEVTLEDKNKVLKVIETGNNPPPFGGTGPFKANVLPEWQILKLKKKDIIMQTTYNGKVYLIELTGD